MEIGFCYYGEGILTLGEEKRKFTGRQFTVIPERFPHTTNSIENTICKWEYLFVDVEGFLRKNCESAVQAEKLSLPYLRTPFCQGSLQAFRHLKAPYMPQG